MQKQPEAGKSLIPPYMTGQLINKHRIKPFHHAILLWIVRGGVGFLHNQPLAQMPDDIGFNLPSHICVQCLHHPMYILLIQTFNHCSGLLISHRIKVEKLCKIVLNN